MAEQGPTRVPSPKMCKISETSSASSSKLRKSILIFQLVIWDADLIRLAKIVNWSNCGKKLVENGPFYNTVKGQYTSCLIGLKSENSFMVSYCILTDFVQMTKSISSSFKQNYCSEKRGLGIDSCLIGLRFENSFMVS